MTKFSQMHKLFIHFMIYRNLDAQNLIEKKIKFLFLLFS